MTSSQAYILPGIKYSNYSPDNLITDVCNYFYITRADMNSKSRRVEFSRPRQIAMYLMKLHFFKIPLKEIGKMIGNRNHATVIHARKAIQNDIDTNVEIRNMINTLNNIINTKRKI